MESECVVRKAIKDDSRRVWEIRNAPEARNSSNNKEPISFESHSLWFDKKYFSTDENRCYVLECKEEVIGYCRFDKEKEGFIISIALDSRFMGKGLGAFLLKQAISLFDKKGRIKAEIEADNPSSIRIFEKAGFVKFEDNGVFLRYSFMKE